MLATCASGNLKKIINKNIHKYEKKVQDRHVTSYSKQKTKIRHLKCVCVCVCVCVFLHYQTCWNCSFLLNTTKYLKNGN